MTSLLETTLNIAKDLLKNPTAPFRESHVQNFIIEFCNARNIRIKKDDVGNLIATYGPQYKNTVFAFEAHMDHPGFIAEKDTARNRLTALFYGGVDWEYFAGSRVKFFTKNGPVKATVIKAEKKKKTLYRKCWLRTEGAVAAGTLGMWDLPAVSIRGDRLYSRACDDVVGCVSVLALLEQLHQRRIRKKAMAIFTVAEEAGLQGVKHLCIRKTVPKNVNIIAIETSSVLPTAKMGDGVVVRVGDRQDIFTPALTEFLVDTARQTQSGDKNFKFQRKLMDAGTCESTVYNKFGYTNAAVCVPLGNYHNRNFKTKKIAAEYVSVSDLENMVKLFLAVVKNSEKSNVFLKKIPPTYKRSTGTFGEFFYRQQKTKS